MQVHIRHLVWHGEGALPPVLLQAQIAEALAAHTAASASPGSAIAQALAPHLPPGGPR